MSALEKIAASVDKQKISARRQLGSTTAATNAFFTVSWSGPPLIAQPAVSAQSASFPQADCPAVEEATLKTLIEKSASEQDVKPSLVRAIVMRESAGRPCVTSVKGAQGLMQLMPATQADLGVVNVFDPAENIQAGVRYLKQMLNRYGGNTALALAAYNAGPARVEPNGKIPAIPETEAYVTDILSMVPDIQD